MGSTAGGTTLPDPTRYTLGDGPFNPVRVKPVPVRTLYMCTALVKGSCAGCVFMSWAKLCQIAWLCSDTMVYSGLYEGCVGHNYPLTRPWRSTSTSAGFLSTTTFLKHTMCVYTTCWASGGVCVDVTQCHINNAWANSNDRGNGCPYQKRWLGHNVDKQGLAIGSHVQSAWPILRIQPHQGGR